MDKVVNFLKKYKLEFPTIKKKCFSCWLDDIVAIAPSISLVVILQEFIKDCSKIIVVFLQELSIELSISKAHVNEPLHR